MSCSVPYSCPWLLISPFIPWLYALQRCCIWCRYVEYKRTHAHSINVFRLTVITFRASVSPPASVHPGELPAGQFLVVSCAVCLHVPGQPICHHLSLLFPARILGLPALCLWLYVSGGGKKAWSKCKGSLWSCSSYKSVPFIVWLIFVARCQSANIVQALKCY